ncbi:hypothetical protein LY28_03423 [Ruminiclostridium sufflavum DSM 19573]|uniref:Uncharacterized protein n=1 Tax=Ruminiclostridium sufflavum DSM 19573 TaxID=1121337 RepID=A0A318XI81_9FIRM|nr:hypothetical protein [Ruminiclostridium sufflavum]PYG84965.1 hypothetical protein LY28_03423 [Ruminiclostridium sufflavum DSM 19573]
MSNLILTLAGQSAYNYIKISSIRLQVSWLYGFKFTLGEKKIVNELELIRLKPIENRMRKYIRGLDEYPASFLYK